MMMQITISLHSNRTDGSVTLPVESAASYASAIVAAGDRVATISDGVSTRPCASIGNSREMEGFVFGFAAKCGWKPEADELS